MPITNAIHDVPVKFCTLSYLCTIIVITAPFSVSSSNESTKEMGKLEQNETYDTIEFRRVDDNRVNYRNNLNNVKHVNQPPL